MHRAGDLLKVIEVTEKMKFIALELELFAQFSSVALVCCLGTVVLLYPIAYLQNMLFDSVEF